MNVLLHAARIAVNAARVAIGWLAYLATGRTPAFSYQAFIRLFCLTGGRSNDMISQALALANPPASLPDTCGVLGDAIRTESAAAIESLRSRGYYVFQRRLPDDICDRLMRYALEHPCELRADDAGARASTGKRSYAAERARPAATRYDFTMQDLVDNPEVQALLADPALLEVAQGYLGSRPVADVLGLWWNTAYAPAPSSEAAQYFHFDLDRPKWVKFFVNLTDVTDESGPHTFVQGSHRSGGIPASLLAKGYTRLSDEEVGASFAPDRRVEFLGPRGTILAEDSRGLHKGKNVASGDRLMLQLQFSNSLFGATYAPVRVSEFRSDAFRELAARYPAVYQAFVG